MLSLQWVEPPTCTEQTSLVDTSDSVAGTGTETKENGRNVLVMYSENISITWQE